MHRHRFPNLSVMFVCLLVFLAVVQVAGAQDGPSFGLSAYSIENEETLSRLSYVLEAGQSETSAVLVTNPGEEEAYLRLSATDARTSAHGGVDFPDTSEPASAAGSWISLSETEFTLQPHEERVIPFTIAVPSDAWAGEHRAGILVELADPGDSRPADFPEDEIYVAVLFRKALNVEVIVPGPTAVDFKVVSVQHILEGERSVFEVELRNEGNISTEVTGGTLEVMDASGRIIGGQPVGMNGKFLEKDTVLHRILFEDALPEGQYSVRVNVGYGESGSAVWESSFDVVEEAVEETEEEAIDKGFDLSDEDEEETTQKAEEEAIDRETGESARPVPEQPTYRMYVILGLLALVVVGVLVFIVFAGGLAWFVHRKGSKGDGGRSR